MKELFNKEDIKRIRKASGLSQTKFASRIGYSVHYLRHIEQGQMKITKEFCQNLKKALNLEEAYRNACLQYAKTQRGRQLPIKSIIFLIILVLIFTILF